MIKDRQTICRENVLVDIDHTISNAFWRDPMIGAQPWDEYHAANIHDDPLPDVPDMLRVLAKSYYLIGFTARPGKWRKQTMDWCLKHRIHLDELLMRPDDNFRAAPELKVQLASERFPDWELKDCIAFILEDREDVCAAFKAIGVTALQVHARKE